MARNKAIEDAAYWARVAKRWRARRRLERLCELLLRQPPPRLYVARYYVALQAAEVANVSARRRVRRTWARLRALLGQRPPALRRPLHVARHASS